MAAICTPLAYGPSPSGSSTPAPFPVAKSRPIEGCSYARTNSTIKIEHWMPAWVAVSGKSKVSDVLVYSAIHRSHLWGKDAYHTCPAEIAELTGLSVSTARRSLESLAKRNLVLEVEDGLSAVRPPDADSLDAGASYELPAWMAVQHSELSPSALLVLTIIHNLATKGSWGFARVSDVYISNVTGIPERTVRRALSSLKDQGLILPYLDGRGRRIGWRSGTSCQLKAVQKSVKMAAVSSQSCLKMAASAIKMASEPTQKTKQDDQLISPNLNAHAARCESSQVASATEEKDRKERRGSEHSAAKSSPIVDELLKEVPVSKRPASSFELDDVNRQVKRMLETGITIDEISTGWKSYVYSVRRRNQAPGGGVKVGWERFLSSFRSWLRFRAAGDIEAARSALSQRRSVEAAERARRKAEEEALKQQQTIEKAVAEFEATDPEVLSVRAEMNALLSTFKGMMSLVPGSPNYDSTQRFIALNARLQELIDAFKSSLLAAPCTQRNCG